jgi:hypothetical protein
MMSWLWDCSVSKKDGFDVVRMLPVYVGMVI